MSSFALKGFVTGLAKGVATGLDEERESTRKNLAFQMKSSYENMQKYNESVAAMKKDIMERDQRLLQFDPSLTQEQRIAAATMPDLLNVYQNLLNQGTKVRLGDLITVGERAKGGNFNTWVSNLGQLEKAADTTGFVVDKKDSFFAPSATAQQRMVAEMSSALGADAQQLARFKTTQDLPSLGGYGAFAPQFLDKLVKQKSIDDQLIDVRGRYAQVATEKGEDSPEAKELFNLNNKLTSYKKNLDPEEADWASTVSALKQQKYQAELDGDTTLIAEADRKIAAALKAHSALTPKTEKETQESLSGLRNLANDTIGTDLRREFGELWKSRQLVLNPDGSITYGGQDLDVKRRKEQIEINATLKVLDPWINNGMPINDRVKSVLISKGVQFDDQGRVLRTVPPITPREEQPAQPSVATPIPTNAISSAASQQQGSMARPFSVTTEEDFNNVPSGAFYRDETTGRLAQKP